MIQATIWPASAELSYDNTHGWYFPKSSSYFFYIHKPTCVWSLVPFKFQLMLSYKMVLSFFDGDTKREEKIECNLLDYYECAKTIKNKILNNIKILFNLNIKILNREDSDRNYPRQVREAIKIRRHAPPRPGPRDSALVLFIGWPKVDSGQPWGVLSSLHSQHH